VLALAASVAFGPALPVAAHHVGTWTPRDNDISANFKQVKFAVQAGRFDVARRLYDTGPLRRELRARAGRVPPGLDVAIREALRAGHAAGVEQGLMVFFLVLVRDLALEADRQLAEADEPAAARLLAGRRFLEAIWRYYNLVDFAVSQRDPRASVAMRLAFDEADTYARGTAVPAAVNPCSGPRSPRPAPAAPEGLRGAIQNIARIVTGVIEASSTPRRTS
jgi:hypothetical protein